MQRKSRRTSSQIRRVCFLTGTRAEFGLMRPVLRAVRDDPRLELQIIATGMHLSRAHGKTVDAIVSDGWNVDAVVPWRGDLAGATGRATAGIATVLERLRSDVVLVCGDRVEAFAGAVAGTLSGRVVAHVHGGDRAAGQVDDSLRHAITKLAHVHFPATQSSADRIVKLGEDAWRVHLVGSPGVDGIRRVAESFSSLRAKFSGLRRRKFALFLQHPVDADESVEQSRTGDMMEAMLNAGFEQVVAIYPNNDPGARGIIRALQAAQSTEVVIRQNVDRPTFLGLLRDAAVLVGNSSAGVIEAGSFTTRVIDFGPRQRGRERGDEVIHVDDVRELAARLSDVWNDGAPVHTSGKNVYGGDGVGPRVARTLAWLHVDASLLRKLIAY